MKALDRLVILLLNLCLLVSAIILPALAFAKSPAYYHRQFARMGLYEEITAEGTALRTPIRYVGGVAGNTALFSDAQLDAIASHIIDFLFGDTEDFALKMDGVYLNGKWQDGVEVFGDKAVTHMRDVKHLMHLAGIGALCALGAVPLLFLYLIIRRRSCGAAVLRYTLIFYAGLLVVAGAFLLTTLLTGGDVGFEHALWQNIHHLFFPFQPEKVAGSFFNDALTSILQIDLFMYAVYAVISILTATLALFFVAALLLRRAERG